jgi:hypothetical protein
MHTPSAVHTNTHVHTHKPAGTSHLISQDAVQALLVHGHQPVHAYVLVLTEGEFEQERNLGARNTDHVRTCHAPVCRRELGSHVFLLDQKNVTR